MMIITIFIGLLMLTAIVSIHEAGHFLTAKKFGVYCKEYAIGMGPKIWQKQKGETVYSIRAIPMGGFVQMIGEDGELFTIHNGDQVWLTFDEAEKVKRISYTKPEYEAVAVTIVRFEKEVQPIQIVYTIDDVEKQAEGASLITCYDTDNVEQDVVANNRQFNHLPPLKKIVVLTAGVFMNFVLGFVAVFGATWLGGVNVEPIIATDAHLDASSEQFQVADKIISIDGQTFDTLDELTAFIQAHANKTVTVTVERAGTEEQVKRKISEATGQSLSTNGIETYTYGVLGITYQRSHHHMGKILTATLSAFWGFFEYVYFVLVGLVSGKIAVTNLTGFIGIAQQTNAVLTASTTSIDFGGQTREILGRVLNFMAFLSVNIGVMNILPFPALDGGRAVFAFYELIFRRKPNPKFETYLNAFGFILLIALFISVTFLDIKRIFIG